MPREPTPEEAAAAWALRDRADWLVRTQAAAPGTGSPAPAADAVLHELQVHQIELEMQNEELRRFQLVLDAARARYFDLYDLAPVGYCTLDEAGLVLEANLAAATLLGADRTSLIHQPFTAFIHTVDQDVYYLHRKELLRSGQRQSCELRLRRGAGTPFWAELVATVAEEPSGARVHRVVLSDVSERKRLEAAMLAKHAELEYARGVAQAASQAKSEFLSRMSHELRTPLNAVLGFAQLMETANPPPSPEQAESLQHILRGGWFLLELVDHILDLSAIESGKLTLVMEAVSLPEVVLDCEAMLGPQANAAGIRLRTQLPEGPWELRADRGRLKQILLNLLTNAIKYSRAGGVVEVSCSAASGERVRVSVRDTGEGLSPEQVAHLFEPFNRLGQEFGDRPGAGIGLVVSRQLAEAMGGTVGAQSTMGVGSVFWVELYRIT